MSCALILRIGCLTAVLILTNACTVSVESEREQQPLAVFQVKNNENSLRHPPPLPSVATDENCSPKQKLGQANCQHGYICVPHPLNAEIGTCLIDCGVNEQGRLVKQPQKCPRDRACMMYRDGRLTPLGMFCLEPELHTHKECRAPYDEAACGNGFSCLPTRTRFDETGRKIFFDYRCKQECSVEKQCQNNEVCLKFEHASRQRQLSDALSTISCSVRVCTTDENCPCDKRRGYACEHLVHGVDEGICKRMLGVCGTL